MSWESFVASVKSESVFCTDAAQPSRYGSMPDLYFTAILPNSNLNPLKLNSCFVTIGISDLAGAMLFIEEPNVIVMDWDKSVINIIQTRLEEWTQVLQAENFDPQSLLHSTRMLENEFSFPYDFEFWERMNMALVEYYRKTQDPRLDELHRELKVAFELYTDLYEKLKFINRGSKYLLNDFNRESMRENSVENKRLALGERYFKLNCKIFFKHVDAAILRRFTNKNICYLNMNLLNAACIDRFIAHVQRAGLILNRINFTDMLDDIVVAPEHLQHFIATLNKLGSVMTDNSTLIFNHINNFSLALLLNKALTRLKQIGPEIANLKEVPTSPTPALEEYAATYLASFKDFSSVYVSKESFYD